MCYEEINLNFTIFSILLGITFAYLVFFFHQAAENESVISSKVVEINAINLPRSMQFLTFSGHREYYYLRRKEVLINEFEQLNKIIQKTDDKQLLASAGKEVQRCITQLAYFFPYKKIIDFNKDGTATIGVARNSIEDNISLEFLKVQIAEIHDLNNRFTLPLKDGKQKIAMAMALASNPRDKNTQELVSKYLERLSEYLEAHHQLALPLGITIKKYEFLLEKVVRWKIIVISLILSACFICGVVAPLFVGKNKLSTLLTVFLFFVGISFLFYDAIISRSRPANKPKGIEVEFSNQTMIASGLPENGQELPWSEYNVNISAHLAPCVAEKIRMLGARCEVNDFGGTPKHVGISLNHSVELNKLQKIILILKECSITPEYISYDKFDIRTTIGLGRTFTVGAFNYKHGPVKKTDDALISKLLNVKTTQNDLENLLAPDTEFPKE